MSILLCIQRHSSPEAYSSFSGNCVGDAASSGCGFVLTTYLCASTFRIRVVTTAVTKRFRPRGYPGGQARVQDGVLTSYMDAAFVFLTPEGSQIDHFFNPGRLTTVPTRLEFV